MKRISVPLTSRGIERLAAEVKKYRAWLKKSSQTFIKRLGDVGLEVASAEFQIAQYDGTNDVSVHLEQRSGTTIAIVAIGRATLFIEFGTGINYPDSHPQAGELGMERGAYGHGLGRLKSWRYKGDPGSNGEVITEDNHKGEIRTKGNPANMPMYKAARAVEEKITEIAREVFTYD